MTKTGYRADIDGLRALAVLAVIAYHYGASWLPGGFTGVDVFFVISGFVITRKLRSDLAQGRFSFAGFYAARVRRIMPALVVVIAMTLAVGWFILLPAEYASLGSSATFAALGLANLFFYSNTGYFDIAAESQPLLHTWSLGVEEQFYLVWPVLIWSIANFLPARFIPRVLGAIVLVGLAFSILQTQTNYSASFYLPFSRAWQLALGGLATFLPAARDQKVSIIASCSGAALIAASFVLVRAGTHFPGYAALPATVGAALLVSSAGQDQYVGRLLSLRPMVAIGRVSYSLYLWHWPVLVLYREATMSVAPSAVELIALLGLTAALSTLGFYLVERPIRVGNLRRSAAIGIAGVGAIVLISSALSLSSGVPSRLPESAIRLAAASSDVSPYRSTCHRTYEFNPPLKESCVFGATDRLPDTVLWGDSHGVEMAEAFSPWLSSLDRSMYQITYSSCPPAQNFRSPLQEGCEGFTRDVLDFLSSHSEIENVYLALYYDLYSETSAQLWTGIHETVDALLKAGKKVTILAPVPNPGYSVPQAAARRSLVDPSAGLSFAVRQHLSHSSSTNAEIENLNLEFPNLDILDPAAYLCAVLCQMVVDGHPVLFDDNHLSRFGASLVAKGYWSAR